MLFILFYHLFQSNLSFELTSPTMGSSYPTAQSTPVVNRRASVLTTPNNSAMSLDESHPSIRYKLFEVCFGFRKGAKQFIG
jgi:hypothetical protein